MTVSSNMKNMFAGGIAVYAAHGLVLELFVSIKTGIVLLMALWRL